MKETNLYKIFNKLKNFGTEIFQPLKTEIPPNVSENLENKSKQLNSYEKVFLEEYNKCTPEFQKIIDTKKDCLELRYFAKKVIQKAEILK